MPQAGTKNQLCGNLRDSTRQFFGWETYTAAYGKKIFELGYNAKEGSAAFVR